MGEEQRGGGAYVLGFLEELLEAEPNMDNKRKVYAHMLLSLGNDREKAVSVLKRWEQDEIRAGHEGKAAEIRRKYVTAV